MSLLNFEVHTIWAYRTIEGDRNGHSPKEGELQHLFRNQWAGRVHGPLALK
jgi:hypothetical protein